MMSRLYAALVGLAVVAVVGCSSSRQEPGATRASSAETGPPGDGVAYFAGGCFWGVEHYLQQLEGVTHVESGYMGGHVEAPTYKQVSSQTTGHLETVRVRFHTSQVSFDAIAKRFFEIHDPTQTDGQGPDIGPEYLSAVFYTSAAQKASTETLIARLESRGYKVATELKPAGKFWIAEDFHQNYYDRTGKEPYCHTRVRRFGD